jgi:hypothetical protein
MPKFRPVNLPFATTIDELRVGIQQQLNQHIVPQLAGSSQRNEDMDLGGNRITSVAAPVAAGDAVPKSYVDRAVAAVQTTARSVRTFLGAAFNPPSDGGASLGSTTLRWLYAFIKSGLNVGGASTPRYLSEFLGTVTPQIHISDHDADDGGWFTSLHGVATYVIHGAIFNSTIGWIAKETSATLIAAVAGGGIQITHNSGLTPGVQFSPTTVFQTDGSGKLTTYNSSATLANGTVTIPKITTSTGSITFVNGVATAFVNPT